MLLVVLWMYIMMCWHFSKDMYVLYLCRIVHHQCLQPVGWSSSQGRSHCSYRRAHFTCQHRLGSRKDIILPGTADSNKDFSRNNWNTGQHKRHIRWTQMHRHSFMHAGWKPWCAYVMASIELCDFEVCQLLSWSVLIYFFHFILVQNKVHLIKKGEKVGASEATLLQMLKIFPFSYGLVVKQGNTHTHVVVCFLFQL